MNHKKIINSTARLIFASMALLGLLLSLSSGTAFAVHDLGLFQLDYTTSPAQGAANVSSTNITPAGNTGDDWDNVYKSVTGNGTAGPSHAFANAFIPDPAQAADTSYFTGGGSKDNNDIPQWQYGVGNNTTPNKDDLTDIFAAAYKPTSGSHKDHTLFYFGADRFDTNGDSQIGFWFFRSNITLGPNGTFEGQHEVGDILILTDMVQGGQIGNIEVYQWVGGQAGVQLLLNQSAADCALAGANDTVCGVINNINGETPPWPYTNSGGTHTYSTGALFEGGFDVNDLLNVPDIGCFSSFLGETRSSQSVNATLKDFALGNFAVCGISVSKTGDTIGKIGDPINYTVTIQNTGDAILYKQSISDTLLGAITTNGVDQVNPYVVTNTCTDSLAAGATCTITLKRTVLAGDPDPLPNTVSIIYNDKKNLNGDQFTSSAAHSVNLFQPAVEIAKTGDALSKVGDSVTYTFTITNMSSQDSPDLNLASISDNVLGDLSTNATAANCGTLAYQGTCSFQVTRTTQAGDADPLVNTVDVLYHPTGFPNDIAASDSHSVNLFQPSVSIDKTGNPLSKIGDAVTYHFKITNTSSADSPALILNTISDDLLGNLSSFATAAGCNSLAPGANCQFDVPWTVAAVDIHPADGQPDDPVINTVTIHFHPDGFPNDITATGSHELNLFQPSIAFSKTADTLLSKATDVVDYTLTLNNTSSTDTPDLVCTITDAKLGVSKTVTLASGKGDVTNIPYTVQASDPDPLVNSASVSCNVTGFPNVLTASSSQTVNLFQPSVMIEKSGPSLSKAGDSVTYTVKITNTSSADSPDLAKVSISDSLVPNIVPPAECNDLAPGASCTFSYSYTIQAGDPDPLLNTVTAHYNPVGFPNDITASGSWSVNLFQPSITFAKSADTTLSKVGDVVNYTLTLNNTSSPDTPALACVVTDTKLGVNKTIPALGSGGTDTTKVPYTVQAGDPDPLVNNASVSCSPAGFPNVLTGSGSWTVNLFQPSVKITKTGPALSKATDTATYNVTIQNTGSADSPNLVLVSFTDSLVAGVTPPASCSPLAAGASCTFSYTYLVKAGDPDPLVNTATVHYNPAGFTNDITNSSTWSTNLFQPSVKITKTGPAFSKATDTATYNVTIQNTSSADAPALVLASFTDSLVAGVTPPASCSPLASGASCTFSYTYLVQAGDPDPLVNTATVHYNPTGFTNDITNSSTWSTDLLHPSFTVTKVCKANTEPISQAGPAVFTITFNNTGDADMHVVPSEGAAFDIAAGASTSYDFSIAGPFSATVNNTVTGTVTLASKYGLANSYTFTASGSCIVAGKVKVIKTVSGQPPAAGQTFTFELRQGASTISDGTILETQNTDASGNISFATNLVPGQTYQLCEWVFPGWNTNLTGDGPLFVPNSIIPPSLPNPTASNLVVCVNFSVTSGQTRTFSVDNTPPPGGRALTIGFWKNWASCSASNGKQKPILDQTLAIATTSPDIGLVVSAQTPGLGWPIFGPAYYLVLKGDPLTPNVAPDCLKAVDLLNKTTIDGKTKKASDPLFNMTAQLVGAQLNFFAGAAMNGSTILNVNRAVLLDGKYQFNGLTYSPKLTAADASLANCLQTQLNNYNNNLPASTCP